MRSYLYLSTAVAGVMMTAGAGTSYAQCVTTQNCAELGYTETSCPDGTGIKCPFGDTFACTGGSCANDCAELGFTYPCTGANESGSGKSCGGKYQSCTCASGYEWKDGACTNSCTIGAIYYSDGTCSNDKLASKTILGVVVYEKTSTEYGWIIDINVPLFAQWYNGTYVDIPQLPNYDTIPTDIQDSCTNTNIITDYCDSIRCPAAWAVKNYKPLGTPAGKNWCLPSAGLLNNIVNNFAKINTGISTAGGAELAKYWYLSSSEHSQNFHTYLTISYDEKGFSNHIRPVIAF